MDKGTPSFDLEAFKAALSEERVVYTRTAIRSAQDMGYSLDDMARALRTLTRKDFYKSMTSYANHRIWQDVYHLPTEDDALLYVKFTSGPDAAYTLLSFKEK